MRIYFSARARAYNADIAALMRFRQALLIHILFATEAIAAAEHFGWARPYRRHARGH